ncbi:U32 family peptidase [bacterium]|nr:U32 family peptidase [bacterium]
MTKPELLIPAGNLEKLETAYLYGADACYMGAQGFSLRAEKSEIKFNETKKAIALARKYHKKIYIALNSFIYDDEIKKLEKIIQKLNEIKPDALIIADPGVINIAQRLKNKIPIHLSTQANTLNSESIKFWAKNGVQRIVLARELSYAQLKKIKKAISNTEIEIFIHGALCISYSGRCYLSKYLVDKDANRGECTQPCRWEWEANETIKPERKLKFEEEDGVNYVLNSKDLCLLKKFPEIFKLKPTSLKIEGRMKSAYYVSIISMVYRQAIDDYYKSPTLFKKNLKQYQNELRNISHRDYTINFWDGYNDNTMNPESSGYIKKYRMVGIVEKYDQKNNELYIKARNEIKKGQFIEILDHQNKSITKIKVKNILDINKNEQIDSAHNSYYIKIPCAQEFPPKAIIRAKIK